MLALIYLALGIALGDVICRRFYRFVSVPHRCAAAILVGILLSTWFTYLAGIGFAQTAEPLLFADLLFFVAAPGAIWWLSRTAPTARAIAPRAPGSLRWDWIMLGALFAAACVLLIGTLYVNKDGTLHLSVKETSDLATQLATAQNVVLGYHLATEFPQHASQSTQFLFFFQAGNLEFLGLNLAWSVDVLSVLVLMSMLAVVMTLGELLFKSRVVGRLGAALFFFHGSLRHLTNFLPLRHSDEADTWRFWQPFAFLNQRYLPFEIGIFLLVLVFLLDQYRQTSSAAGTTSATAIAFRTPNERGKWNRFKRGFASRFIATARSAVTDMERFVFSGLLLAALPLWNGRFFIATVVVMCCLLLAYGSWWSSRAKTPAAFGRVLAGIVVTFVLAAGVVDLWVIHSSSRTEVNPEKEPLVKGLTYRNSVIYKIPRSFPPRLAPEGSSKLPSAFEGGRGTGRGQFDSPRAIATDSAGNIFVADTGNGRVEKFSPVGTFLSIIGGKGGADRQLADPNGIAVDRAGNIYVAEIGSKHCVQKLGPDGTFIAEWAPGLYGPRRIAIGPDGSIYVVDSGRSRIVKLSPNGEVVASLGSEGSDDGQFIGLTSVAVDPTTNKIYVADPINKRIQVLDSTGRFLTKWPVPEWVPPAAFEDLAIDPGRGRLYASSAHMNIILVFDLQGNRIGTLAPRPPEKLDEPSGLALAKDKLLVLNAASARVSVIPLPTSNSNL